jgi:uncharacterized membrane protein YjjB (DUF3815 family)
MTPAWAQAIFAFGEAMAFSVLFGIPRKKLLPAGLAGMLSWTVYLGAMWLGTGRLAAAFIGAAFGSAYAEIAARQCRVPVTLFIVPTTIPLVPGYDVYSSMLAFLRGQNTEGFDTAIRAMLLALSIAAGIVAVATLFRIKPCKNRQT